MTGTGPYALAIETLPNLTAGVHVSPITFRLCQETACTNVYQNTAVTFTYTLDVKLAEWTAFQRNPAHTGYIHAKLDPAKFRQLWTWTTNTGGLSDATPANGNVYVMTWPPHVHSLSEQTGAVNWTTSLASPRQMYMVGTPAYHDGVVYVASKYETVGHTSTSEAAIRALDAKTGAYISDSPYESQFPEMNSPTFFEGDMFHTAGIYGNTLYKYRPPATAPLWSMTLTPSNAGHGQTPAVNEKHVYVSTHYGIAVYDRKDGTLLGRYSDPISSSGGRSALMGPVIAPSGNIIVTNAMVYDEIMSIDPNSRALVWRTSGISYAMQPAVAGTTVYAVRYGTTVDAINETDGKVLWTWTPPFTDPGRIAENNILVFENLLFVSTETTLYAIDRKTHTTAWSSPTPGRLSFSSNYVLYVVNSLSTPKKITAIKLAD